MTTHFKDRQEFKDHRTQEGTGFTSVTRHHCRGTTTHWVQWEQGVTTGRHHTTHGG